ncbi:hypothetical protein [Nonomuraea sp. NPDC050783]|uniref:hypothetical protein n=1 Tax=Nonomuraea sp. NPDC050783 TaxID=3154634 RepID=UPI003465FB5D
MNTAGRLGVYVLGLAVVFGGALGVGRVTAPDDVAAASQDQKKSVEQGQGHGGDEHGGNGHGEDGHGDEAVRQVKGDTPGGLQVSQDGYTLNLITTPAAGRPADLTFRITGPDLRPVTAYKVEHDKKMHFIVVSRDLTSFQHVHPEMAADGTWKVRLALPKPGSYRAFADFAPEGGAGGAKLTLGADLQAAGDYRPEPLPHASRTATVGDYTVNLAGNLVPGQASKLTLTVSRNGEPVTDLQPYLGAYGHLVALRAGDLAYLHVHPEESEQAGPEITFYAEVPSTGTYRLFLDFQHDDQVRTASFTVPATLADGHVPSAGHDHSH